MSLPFALRSEGSYLLGQPLMKFQRTFSLPSSSKTTMAPLRRASFTFPSMTIFLHSHSTFVSVSPHLRVIFPYLVNPGILRMTGRSVPSRYSTRSLLVSPIAHSVNPACWMPWISSRKRELRYGSFRSGIVRSFQLSLGTLRLLRDAEDDEFRRFDWRDPDVDYKPPQIAGLWRVVFVVDLDEESLLGRGAEQRPVAPDRSEKGGNVTLHFRPQRPVLGLENHPLRTLI